MAYVVKRKGLLRFTRDKFTLLPENIIFVVAPLPFLAIVTYV